MIKTEKYLAIWQLNDKLQSIPIPHRKVCEEFEAISPDISGQEILNFLRCSNLIEVNSRGEYLLTFRGIQLRRNIPERIVAEKPENVPTGKEWERFRKVLSYYLNCVHLQERTQEYLNEYDLNRNFWIPILPPRWLKSPGQESRVKITFSREQKPAAQKLLTRQDDDEEIYLGYPVSAYILKSNSGICYSPIGLIPVDVLSSSATTLEINLRLEEAEINQQWLEFSFPQEQRNSIINHILRLHAKDEFRGVIDLLQALPLLERPEVRFDPEKLDLILPRPTKNEPRIPCNCAVLFVGKALRYSKTLKRELTYIRDHVSDAELDTTALAYIFREPLLKDTNPHTKFMPLPFIESNPEQMAAIDAALNLFSTKITGPPGTGKSQVAVNILANFIYNGKTALFTSKNHKAVEAIFERSRQLLSEPGLALVNFCTQADPNPWYRQDLDLLMAGAGAAEHKYDEESIFQIETAVDHWRHIENAYAPRHEILIRYERWLRQLKSVQSKMVMILEMAKAAELGAREFHELKYHVANLADTPELSWRTFLPWLKWNLGGKKKDALAREFLETVYPDFWHSVVDISELKKKFQRFSELYKQNIELYREGKPIEQEARKQPEIQMGERQLKCAFEKIVPHLRDALLIRRIRKIRELCDNPELINRLKNIMTFMKSANSPAFFQRLNSREAQEAETGFQIFSRYYPGWAVSLLSLTKASPCIPNLFDVVIIDEASQCDPASIIPALFRAKSVVMIGDSNQFPPVIDMKPLRNDFLKTKNRMTEVADQRFDFMSASAFDLSSVFPIMLKEHFRCAEEIADYFNDAFYANELHIRTDSSKLKMPAHLSNHHAISWVDVPNSQPGEVEAVIRTMKDLAANHYPGTIGIITPFRQYAEELKETLYPLLSRWPGKAGEDSVLISTANGFQGGERDLIIFVLGYNDELSKGKLWYAESQENRYIYNVAVSRARACLIIIGDRTRCRNSSVSVLNKLAQLPRPARQDSTEKRFESPWEEKLYNSLLDAGIETHPQYPLAGRRLDLALIQGELKIDIEVDGVHYHTDSDGERKMDDIYRDLQVGAMGWIVQRFWVYELRDDMPSCVEAIQRLVREKTAVSSENKTD